jgi:hypothetical protein
MKALKTILIVALVLIVIPLLGFAVWFLQRGENIEVFMVNKSMVEFNGSENKSMNYILNREKILTPGNRKYDLTVDHYGLLWDKGDYTIKYPRLRDLNRTAEKSDMVYFADVRGIKTSQIRQLKDGEEDVQEYGGLNNSDYTLMRYVMELGKPMVLECSFYGGTVEPLVRYNIEKLTDVYYVGWMGKYMKDLSADTDQRCEFDYRKEYEDYHGKPWTFSGPGIVMINTDANRVVVLQEGEDIHTRDGLIRTDPGEAEAFHLPNAVNYAGWFTVLHPGRNEVVSTFELNPSEGGMEILQENGLPDVFPAVIHGNGSFYFLAGDFGKNKVQLCFSRVPGLRDVIGAVRKSGTRNPNNFFFTFYQPFMNGILDEVREQKKEGQ